MLIFLVSACKSKKEDLVPKKELSVRRGTVFLEISATGAVKPQVGASVKVGARISGRVEKLFVQTGDFVKKGQLIAIIEHADLEAQVKAQEAQIRALESQLKEVEGTYPYKIKAQKEMVQSAKAELNLAKLNYKRVLSLYNEGLAAKVDLDQVEKDLNVKQSNYEYQVKLLESLENEYRTKVENLKASINSAKEELNNLRVKLGYAYIYSPISGVVSDVTTQEGETVVAGLNAPTFITVIDLSRLEVDAYVDETDIGKIAPGMPVRFTVDAYPDKVFEGKVRTIYPGAIIRNNVVFYNVPIDITTNYYGLLRPEMTANVVIVAGKRENVLVVPVSSVKIEADGKSYVYVKNEKGKWVKREVKTGWSSGGFIEIVDGLKEGEVVGVW
jgi:HlyD family secretion protein/macrolide-specific efflux system membrane fusion protein